MVLALVPALINVHNFLSSVTSVLVALQMTTILDTPRDSSSSSSGAEGSRAEPPESSSSLDESFSLQSNVHANSNSK